MPGDSSDRHDPAALIGERARADVTRIMHEVLDRGEYNLQPLAAAGLDAAIDVLKHEPDSDGRDSLIQLATEMARCVRLIETMLARAADGDERYTRLRMKLAELGQQWSTINPYEPAS